MPIQDDIDDANLSRLEREAQRQKKAAQQAPTVQYMGTDGATGRARVIGGSGASSVGVANHSNTQARPGDIKRGFAKGFDRGNVRRSEVIRPRRTKTGEVMVLFSVVNSATNKKDLYIGGHVKDPIKLSVSFDIDDVFAGSIEAVGDSDYIVGYQNTTKKTVGVIRSNGPTWEQPIPAWSGFLTYKGSGFFDSASYPQAVYFLRPVSISREALVDSDDQYPLFQVPFYRTRTRERTSNRVDTNLSPDPYGIFNPTVFEHDLMTIVVSGGGNVLKNPPEIVNVDNTSSYLYEASSDGNYIYSTETGLNIVKGKYNFTSTSSSSTYSYESAWLNTFQNPVPIVYQAETGGSGQSSTIEIRESMVYISINQQRTYLIRESSGGQTINDTVSTVRYVATGTQATRVSGSSSTTFNYTHEIYNGGIVFDSGNSYFYRIERGAKNNQFQNPVLSYEYFLKYKNGEIQIPSASFRGGFASLAAMKYDSILDPTGKPVIAEFEYYGGTLGQNNPTGQDPLIAKVTRKTLNSSSNWVQHSAIEKPVFAIPDEAEVYDLDYFSS